MTAKRALREGSDFSTMRNHDTGSSFSSYIAFLLDHRKLLVVLVLSGCAWLALGIPKLSLSSDARVYFSKDNPQLAAFEALERTFTKQDTIFFVIQPLSGDVFTEEILSLVWDLTRESWTIPFSQRVSSMSNYQRIEGTEDDLSVQDLIEDSKTLTGHDIEELKRFAQREPTNLNNTVARDGSMTGISVTLSLPDGDTAAHKAVKHARQLVTETREKYPEATVRLAGSVLTNVTIGEAILHDIQTLVVLSYAIMVFGLLFFLRSIISTVVTLSVITLSIVATFGIFGWLGTTLSPTSGFVPSVVMTIAVADSIHILMTYHHELRRGATREAAIREALRINASPVFITTITTAVGVLSLNFSDSPPYRDLGNMVAVGVVIAYLLSMVFLPAMATWLPPPKRAGGRSLELGMASLARWVVRHHRVLLWVNIAVSVVLTSFLSRNELTERWHEYFGYSYELRHAVEAINDGLGGIHSIQYVLDTGVPDGIHDPQYLNAVEGFAAWYRAQAGVAHVASIADVLKDLNKALHESDPGWYRVPQQRGEAAQYLLLHELSLPMGMGLDNLIDTDRSATRFTAIVHKTDSETLLGLDDRARQWLSKNAPKVLPTEGTSLDMVFSHINHRNIRSLLFGTGVALVVISILLMIALRSVSLGFISLFPNLAPAAMAYGWWGLLVGHIDMALSVVVCMSLGIVVDDTVHFLSKYQRARKERQLSAAAGIRYAFSTVGAALTTTSVILIAGFAVLGASDFTPTRETGTLLAATLTIALLVDFLLLPPLLLRFDREGQDAVASSPVPGRP